ncbi:MAG: pilus assembly protein [Alphaproteobacteria bacterium]|nr:pilus assembly protein [Alphaproteobacteria bacterium]
MRALFRRFCCHQQGVALIEFVFVLPLILLLVLGGTELTRYVLITQKIDKAGYAIADSVAQSPPDGAGALSEATLNATLTTYDSLLRPFDNPARQSVIVTSLQRCGVNNRILWQFAGGGTLSNGETTSIVNGLTPAAINASVQNSSATFPAAISSELVTMMNEENMIVAEVFYSYEPFLSDVLDGIFDFAIQPAVQVRRVFLHPRNGTLNCLPPSFGCADCASAPGGSSSSSSGGGPGDICPPGSCGIGSLAGAMPCECVPSGGTTRGWNSGPDGCGLYRCNNGSWTFIGALICTTSPVCP